MKVVDWRIYAGIYRTSTLNYFYISHCKSNSEVPYSKMTNSSTVKLLSRWNHKIKLTFDIDYFNFCYIWRYGAIVWKTTTLQHYFKLFIFFVDMIRHNIYRYTGPLERVIMELWRLKSQWWEPTRLKSFTAPSFIIQPTWNISCGYIEICWP